MRLRLRRPRDLESLFANWRGVAPASVSTMDIYRGIVPFVLIQIGALIVLALFPKLALWLPKLLYG